MNVEEAVLWLKRYQGYEPFENGAVLKHSFDLTDETVDMILSAIGGANIGEPLTLEQLREMDGQPVWAEFEDGSGGLWGIVHISVFEQIVFPNGLHCTIGQPYYGKIYKAYAYAPTHIDREAWSDCPYCGEDLFSEYGFRRMVMGESGDYCKYCGKPQTEEAWDELEKRLRG